MKTPTTGRSACKTSGASCSLITILIAAAVLAACPTRSRADWLGSDEDFIAMVEKNHWDFYRDHQNGGNGLWRADGDNRWQTFNSWSCSAGNGFGMAATVVAAYRGWISDEEAYNRILPVLQTYETVERTWDGIFRHWYNYADGSTPGSGSEISTIDSSWFIAGALLAAEYFRGTEVDVIANRLYEGVGFDSAHDPAAHGYSEFIIIDILGAGSPTHAFAHPSKTSDAWDATVWPHASCPLFWHQWPQAFVDFRYRPDRRAINHFDEARGNIRAHRQKCIDLNTAEPTVYDDYSSDVWGLTAAEASTEYIAMHPFGGEYMCDSGSVCPVGLPACMAHTPTEARSAMKYVYDNYDGLDVFGPYGFMQTFNTVAANSGSPYSSHKLPTADIGCNVLMIENFRSGTPWKYFMRHPDIQTGMDKLGMPKSIWVPYHDDWNDGADTNVWGGYTGTSHTDGSHPTAAYVGIVSNNAWVNGNARRMATTGSGTGDTVYIDLNQTDQSRKDLLSFWMRGAVGGEVFDVGLKDDDGHEVMFSITNFVPGGTVPTAWCRVRVPLRDFAVSGDPNNDVRLTFLGDFVVRFQAPGTIDIEDLGFVDDDIRPDTPATFGAACIDGRVHFRWSPSAHEDVVGYQLWRRPDAISNYQKARDLLVSYKTTEIDPTVESRWGEDFYYVVQAYDRHGHTSGYSSAEYEQRVWIGPRRDLDWGDGQNPNTLGGGHSGWGSAWSNTFVLASGWDGTTKWVRRFGAGSGGAYMELNSGNLSAYDALAFWVKKDWGGDDVEVGLKSTDTTERKVDLGDYAPGGVVPDTWTYITIPFIDLKDVDFTSMENLSFTFNAPGSVFVQEIRFVRMDHETDILFVGEGENPGGHLGGSTDDFKWLASGAYVLGNSWATNAGDDVWWVPDLPAEPNEAYLEVRYACGETVGRTLQVFINSEHRADLSVAATGGWGDEAWHFSNDVLRLGRITATSFLLKLTAPDAGSAVNLDRVILRSATHYFREAEDWDSQSGSSGPDSKPGASGGAVLGASWGSDDAHYAVYSNIVIDSDISNAILRARYGQNWNDGRLVRVKLNGSNMGHMAFSYTKGWLDNWCEGTITELPLGVVPAGVHTLRLETEGADEAVNIDWLRIDDQMAGVKEYDTDGDGIPDSQEALYGTSSALFDMDSDGLSDLHELSMLGGFLTDPDDADSDDDQMPDGDEDVAGTNPTDAESVFVLSTALPQQDGSIALNWEGSAASSYDIQYSDGGFGNGSNFESVTDPENISVVGSTVSYVDDGTGTTPGPDDPSVTQRNYRIRAYRP